MQGIITVIVLIMLAYFGVLALAYCVYFFWGLGLAAIDVKKRAEAGTLHYSEVALLTFLGTCLLIAIVRGCR